MKIALYILIGLVLFVLVSFYIMGKKSKNGTAPGLVDGRLAPCSSKPNCASSEDGTPDAKKVEPLAASQWDALKSAVRDRGGVITSETDSYFSSEFSTSVFKFTDDFEARLDGDLVHVRSSSRVGYSDRGVNKARIKDLRSALAK
jgi:uncharacterized protein (DUF1499 family)